MATALRLGTLALGCWLLGVGPAPLAADDPAAPTENGTRSGFACGHRLDDLVVRAWGVDEGLPSVALNRVLQSTDGHLWISSFDGLVRFDGLSFRTFDKVSMVEHGPAEGPPLLLASNGFRALANGAGGELWVGTDGHGVLLHHEGRFQPVDAQDMGDWTVQVIHPGEGGELWVGASDRGARRLRRVEGSLSEDAEDWYSEVVIEDQTVRDIVRVGEWVWLATEGAGVIGRRLLQQAGFEHAGFEDAGFEDVAFGPPVALSVAEGLPSNAVTSLGVSGPDELWIGMLGGLARIRLDASGGAIVSSLEVELGLTGKEVEALHAADGGDLWIGASQGLFRLSATDGSLERLESWDETQITNIRSLAFDREGSLWLTSTTAGLVRLRESPFRNIGRREGLAGGRVGAVLPEPAGSWLLAADRGLLYRVEIDEDRADGDVGGEGADGIRVRPWQPEPPLPDERIRDLHRDGDGTLWIATYSGLSKVDPEGRRRQWTTAEGLPSNQVRVVHRARSGDLWAGTRNGGLFRVRQTSEPRPTVEVLDRRHGLASNFVFSIDDGADGGLWIGARGGLHHLDAEWIEERLGGDGAPSSTGSMAASSDSAEPPRTFASGDELPGTLVFATLVDDEGVWVCTDGGLVRIEGDRVLAVLGADDGLPGDSFFDMVEDASGRYWLSSTSGAVSIGAAALRARARQRQDRLDIRRYDDRDGMISRQITDASRIGVGRGGHLVFPTLAGVAIFDPSYELADLPAPSVLLAGLVVDGMRHDLGGPKAEAGGTSVPAGSQRLEIELAALSFVKPEDLRVRYQLVGFDRGWVEAGQERVAVYTNLDPGDYLFRAEAINASGVRSVQEGRLNLVVEPFWHQRPGVRAGLVAIGLLFGYGLFRWRMAAVEARNRRLEEIVAMQQQAERASREAAERERAISARLREVDRVKDEFLANTSHELRTPLYGMVGLAESLIDDPEGELPEEVRADLGMIVSSGHRLGRLVDDILDSAKLDRGRLELIRGPVEIHALTDVVLTLAKPLAEQKGLELVNSVSSELPRAWADELRLQQVIHNLLGNAIKFSSRGRVEVTATQVEADLLIAVSDRGIGIPEEHLESIFDTFAQVDASIDRAHGGTGLGLAIARQLVELHEGRIWAESELGRGTTFYFTLPIFDREAIPDTEMGSGAYRALDVAESAPAAVARAVAGEAEGPAEGARARARTTRARTDDAGGEGAEGAAEGPRVPTGGGASLAAAHLLRERSLARHSGQGAFTVLIVDDEAVVRKVLFNHLAPHGYRLLRAKDGPECLGMLAREPVDLVLLDLMMPRMSGYEVCRTIRQSVSREDLPILLMSAKNQERDRIAGFAEGANDYLTKPITKGELLARIRLHLELVVSHRREKDRGKMLRGLLPICSSCKKIRDDQGYWKGLEEYISRHSEAEITHSLCPTCAHDLFPDEPPGRRWRRG